MSGFSRLILLLLVASILIGGGFYFYRRDKIASSQMPQITYMQPTEKAKKGANGGRITKPYKAGNCELFENNPRLSDRFEKTDAKSCGSMAAGDYNNAALINIRTCINDAVRNCTESKSYINIQKTEGSIEYLLTTNNCRIFVERWGTVDPYCGSNVESCNALSTAYPDEMCDSPGGNTIKTTPTVLLPRPTSRIDKSGAKNDECNTRQDCEGKVNCAVNDPQCVIAPACVDNTCVCDILSCE